MSRLSSPLTFTRRLCALVALATSAAWFGTARGDVYELEGGGEVRGSLVERGANGAYVVQTEDGAWPGDLHAALQALPAGHAFNTPDNLFAKITDDQRTEWEERFKGVRK